MVFICATCFSHTVVGQQVEHNYTVGPKQVDCDSIKLIKYTEEKAITLIRNHSYRFQQKFRLTRKQGFQGAEFYSCNSSDGFLIIKYTNQEWLYLNVKKDTWDFLISSQDPEGFYLKISNQLEAYKQ